MILVDLDGVAARRPDRPLFEDLRLTIATGDRIGVVGINGAGKSTLLDIVADEVAPEGGTVRRRRGVRLGYLGQRPHLGAGLVQDVVGEGWQAAAAAERLGLGPLMQRPVAELSGGQAKRAALARALATDADLLVLDEPTNHVDLDGILWLEDHLAARGGALVLVTHDRAFLDRVTTSIVALDPSGWSVHDGGYRAWLAAEAEREARQARTEASRRILARRELAWLQRGARARRRKPRSRLVTASRVLEPERPSADARAEGLVLDTFGTPRLGRRVVELGNVSFRHRGGPPLFEHIDLQLDRRARLGVIGANGSGKSTLLDLMAGRLQPTLGTVGRGSTVAIGYLDQHGRVLDPQLRAREVLAGPDAGPDHVVTALMERFWFDHDAQMAPVATLSGGERRRLELLAVLAGRPNVLLLDEPTNDLDLASLRALEDFLDGFGGALVTVSHDRAFLERVVEHVVAVEAGRVELVAGGDAVWQRGRGEDRAGARRAERTGRVTPSRPVPAPTDVAQDGAGGASPSTLRHRMAGVERELDQLQAERDGLRDRLEEVRSDHRALAELGLELAALDERLAEVEERWLDLGSRLEALEHAAGAADVDG